MLNLLAAEEHHPNKWLLPGDINEVIWGSAAFAVVFAMFLWKGLPALKKAMHARSSWIAAEIAAAEQARSSADAELASVKSSLANADDEAKRIVDEAKVRATTVKSDLMSRAEAEVETVRARAQAEIAASKGQALADLRAEVATRSMVAAEAVVRSNLDGSTQSDLIDRYIEQVGGSR